MLRCRPKRPCLKPAPCPQRVDFSQVPFSAIFVFHDSRDWGFDTQIMLDVLMSPDGTVTTWRDPEAEWTQQVPVFFSNPDLLWVRLLSRLTCITEHQLIQVNH